MNGAYGVQDFASILEKSGVLLTYDGLALSAEIQIILTDYKKIIKTLALTTRNLKVVSYQDLTNAHRNIDWGSVTAILISTMNSECIIKVANQPDLYFESAEYRTQIVKTILNIMTDGGLTPPVVDKLPIYFIEENGLSRLMTTKRMVNFGQMLFLGDEDFELHNFDTFSAKDRKAGGKLRDLENNVEIVFSLYDKFTSVLKPLKVSEFNVLKFIQSDGFSRFFLTEFVNTGEKFCLLSFDKEYIASEKKFEERLQEYSSLYKLNNCFSCR